MPFRPPRPFAALALLVLVAAPLAHAAPAARTALPPLIPRAALFAPGADDFPALSPDGTQLVWSHRGEDGTPNLWVRDLATGASRQVTHDKRGVNHGAWTPDGRRLLYLGDDEGDENQHLFAADVKSGESRDLTPFPNTRVEGFRSDPRKPGELLVGMNRRDPRVFDLDRVDLATGRVTPDTENPGDVISWATDEQFRVRGAVALRASDAATILRVRDDERSPWRDLVVWPFTEAGFDRYQRILGFTDAGRSLIVQSSVGHNTSALVKLDAATGRETAVIAHDPRCDLWNVFDATGSMSPVVLFSADGAKVQAVGFEAEKPSWRVIDPSVAADFRALEKLAAGGVVHVEGRDDADRRWLVRITSDRTPGRYLLWERAAKLAKPLFEVAPELARWTFAPVEPIAFRARDGLMIGGYLTRPVGAPAKGLPLVVNVHGGPWTRDVWGFNPEMQWLANRGYAVLQVNFRGSTGFGNTFLQASTHQFGTGAVQHDISDAVKWAVETGLADPKRVGIFGWSYGGYAALAGLAFTPELYACGVDGVGPSDLATLINSFPAYWGPRKQRWLNFFGDVVADTALNRRLSPLHHVSAMRAPLLIGHGAHDPRVNLSASEAIVAARRAAGGDVTFVVYPDEGHGFGRAENNRDYYGRVEEFLAKHLGGRAEPWEAVPGATAQVK